MTVMKMLDGVETQHAQRQLGTASESCGVIWVDAADSDQEVAVGHFQVHLHWSSEGGLTHLHQALCRGVVDQNAALGRCFRPNLLRDCPSLGGAMGSGSDYDLHLARRDASVLRSPAAAVRAHSSAPAKTNRTRSVRERIRLSTFKLDFDES